MPVRPIKTQLPASPLTNADYFPVPLDCVCTEDLEALETAYFTLANLCQLSRRARAARARGRITEAQKLESAFEQLYSKLPNFARW